MKKLLLSSFVLLLFNINAFAQNSIQININHKLANADFAMEAAAKNNIDHDFEVVRLEYYLSEITIVHDGGTETVFDEFWVLVNASSEPTQINLEDSDITNVEMIKLHVGVDEEHNHFDPATFPQGHPLSPQMPSMHWGWAAGYRFVAMEGYGGSNYDQLYQLHALGDDNYFTTEIPYTTSAVNNALVIDLDADYTRALEDIEVNSGVIVHGEFGDAKKCLENFRDFVFFPAGAPTSTVDFSEVKQFEVFPNPTVDGQTSISLSADKEGSYDISVTDVLGNQVAYYHAVNGNSTVNLQLENAGFYFVNLWKEGQVVISKKLISK